MVSDISTLKRRFQFSLRTAIVCVFAAALLVYANSYEQPLATSQNVLLVSGAGWPWIYRVYAHGECKTWFHEKDVGALYAVPIADFGSERWQELTNALYTAYHIAGGRYWRLLGNVVIALLILISIAFVSERGFNRRKSVQATSIQIND